MDLFEYLGNHGIALDELVANINDVVQLQPGDVLFAAGSLVEGLGNAKSDVDFFLLTSRDDINFTSLNAVALLVRGCLIDIRVVQHAEVETFLRRFTLWAEQSRLPRSALGFTYEERKTLHRLSSGIPLHGEARFQALQKYLRPQDLVRFTLDWSRFMASTVQIDLAGFRQCGDSLSMTFSAQDLLGYTVDALLAGYGFTNPGPKWRARQLGSLPDCWMREMPGRPTGLSAAQMFVELHRAPAGPALGDALRHASHIVAFSRVVFPWMEYRILGSSSVALPQLPAVRIQEYLDSEDLLPRLDLDVQVAYRNSRFEMWRLNEQGAVFELSPLAYSVLCLFDGETSRKEATSSAARIVGDEEANRLVDEVCEMVEYGRFEAPVSIDEGSLNAILRR